MKVTFRSVVLGLALAPFTCLFGVMIEVVWLTGYPSALSLFYHVVFILFWLTLLNLVIQRYRPAWAFSPTELLVVYTMLSLSAAMAGHDMLQVMVPAVSHIQRAHQVEGTYGDIVAVLPEWLMMADEQALDAAYSGQESIYRWENLGPWLKPLGWWALFVAAWLAVMWGILLAFRKQWTENEKLAYPIIQVPQMLSAQLHTLLHSRAFWIAFGLTAAFNTLNGFHELYPAVPHIPHSELVNIQQFFPERPWSDMGWAPVSFYPFAIGICFFIPLDLAFSAWFFWMFWKLERVFASHIGMQGLPGFPYVEEQAAGGYYAIAFMAVWISRHHLARLGRMLAGRGASDATGTDRAEARLAAGFIVAGLVTLFVFCSRAGMSWHIIVMFFGLYFLLGIGVTRIRAELGPPAVDTYGMGPHLQIPRLLGAARMARPDLAMLGFMSTFARTSRSHPMPHGMEGFRIAERFNASRMKYLAAMLAALAIGVVSAYWAMLFVYNKYGISAQIVGIPYWLGTETWDRVNTWMTAPERWTLGPSYALVVGMLFAFGMMALRVALPWWPFHPVGFAMGAAPWTMDLLWMSFLVAWAVKLLLLKYGGAKLYRPAVPFFVGLILGDFVTGGCWNLYGIFAGVQVYHFWP